ncbi:MAG: hypothetical protein IJ458_03740 [Clostridia bacterium]|nr:hypothetical protein [Clostridia bacterium]
MYLKYIDNQSIDRFIKSIGCPYSRNIIIADSEQRNYINVFTNMLDTTFHITDYECINVNSGKIYSRQWRKFIIAELDKQQQGLGDKYIDGLHDYLEQDSIYGAIL